MKKFDLRSNSIGSYEFPLLSNGEKSSISLEDFCIPSTPVRLRIVYKDIASSNLVCGASFIVNCSNNTRHFEDLKASSLYSIPDCLSISEIFSLPPFTSRLADIASESFCDVERHPLDVAWDVSLKRLKALAANFLVGGVKLQSRTMVCKLVDQSETSYAFYFRPLVESEMFFISIKITPDDASEAFLDLWSESTITTFRFII